MFGMMIIMSMGAPGINPKRPYGNSFVMGDIVEILNIENDLWDEDGNDLPDTEELRDYLHTLHIETKTALEIILGCQTFDTGIYIRDSEYSSDPWRLATPEEAKPYIEKIETERIRREEGNLSYKIRQLELAISEKKELIEEQIDELKKLRKSLKRLKNDQ